MGKKKLDRDIAESLFKHIKTRLAELINKVLTERSKLKYKEFIEYLRKNPKKTRRRFGFIKLTQRHLNRMNSISHNRESSSSIIQSLLQQRVGGATFIKRGSVSALKQHKSVKVRNYINNYLA